MTALPQSSMIRLISRLLELSAHEFSFPLAQVLPDVDQRRTIVRECHEAMPQHLGAFDPERTYETWSAWHLARHIAQTAALEAETVAAAEQRTTETLAAHYRAIAEHTLPGELGIDAQRWAQACIAIAPGAAELDEGLMIGWFANAIEQGIIEGQTRAERDVIPTEGPTVGVMLLSLAACGEHVPAIHDNIVITTPPGVDPGPTAEKVAAVMRENAARYAELDALHGVGPGTEFPNLPSSSVAIHGSAVTTTEGVAISRVNTDPGEFVEVPVRAGLRLTDDKIEARVGHGLAFNLEPPVILYVEDSTITAGPPMTEQEINESQSAGELGPWDTSDEEPK